MVFVKSSSIFLLTTPDPFFKTWIKGSCSPCMSDKKCSVPFGRFNIASKLIISVLASDIVLYWLDISFKYLNLRSFSSTAKLSLISTSKTLVWFTYLSSSFSWSLDIYDLISSTTFPSTNCIACLIAFLIALASELPCAFIRPPSTPKNGAPPCEE